MTASFGALQGIRVLDFSHMIAGPYITLMMAYHGAEVIKIESGQRYDGFRRRRGDEELNASRPFADFNRNKRDVTINLKKEAGRDLVKRLAVISDVAVENFSADVLTKLGLSYRDLCQARPDLIMLSTQGMGQSGPYRDFVGWGPSAMAFSGMTALWNHADAEDVVGSQTAHPDYLTAHGLVAILAALHHRVATGRGQYIELAQVEAAACLIGPAFVEQSAGSRPPTAQGNVRQDAVPHNVYRCQGDDAWCAIAVHSDTQWVAFCTASDHVDWAHSGPYSTLLGRLRRRAELDLAIEDWTSRRPAGEVAGILQRAGVPASVVASGRDLVEDAHLRARGFLMEVDHPRMGSKLYAGIPARFSNTPPRLRRHAPLLGQDNDYVFRELLHLSEAEIRALEDSGAIG